MKLLSLTAVLAGSATLCAVIAMAQDSRESAIRSVIDRQLEAFRVDDFSTAFEFASPSIRELFGDATRFGLMVQQGYPMVWRSSEVSYLGLAEIEGGWRQRVIIRDAEGRSHVLEYDMMLLNDSWQINGVRLLPATGLNA